MNEKEMMKVINYHISYDISEEDKKRQNWEYIDISHDEFHEFRNAVINLINLYNKANKVIDLMAEDISEFNMNMYCEECREDVECKECIREYYFKKARGEED